MNTTNTNLPDGWELKHIEDLANINPPKKSTNNPNTKVSFIKMADISTSGKIISKSILEYKQVSNGFTSFIDGDILVAKITPCFENGKGALVEKLVNGIGFGSTEFHVIRVNGSVEKHLLYYHTIKDDFRKAGKSNMTGSVGQKRVPKRFIERYPIPLPPLPEQKKIVEILSTWDRAIERTERLIGSKKRHRGQTLNKLMSKTRGEKTNLGKICTFQSGGTPSTKNDVFWQGSIPWITGGDIEKQSVTSIRKHITKQAIEKSSTHLAPKDTILLVTRTGVGKIALTEFDIAISQDITAIYPSKKTIDNHFLFWSLYYSNGKLENLNQGTSINGILRKDLEKLKIKTPPLQEQKKIANLLGTIENEIRLLEQELKRLKKQKKGLLQKLLTGEVRVKP